MGYYTQVLYTSIIHKYYRQNPLWGIIHKYYTQVLYTRPGCDKQATCQNT